MPDLSTLNPAEREALTLLAQGHTAKSIASITGRSVGSINERLREARRKTGVGSSRELARLFAAQENRDEQIGVAPDRAPHPPANRVAATGAGGRFAKGLILMLLIGLAGLVAASLYPATQATPDWLIATEARDAHWADAAESALRARYAAVPEVVDTLHVECRMTLCLVTADFPPNDATMQRLQGLVAMTGLKNHSHGFTLDSAGKRAMRYTSFWLRAGG